MSRVAELEQKIRDIYNIPRRHKKSRGSHGLFLQACSSLDVIGDTEYAFEAYQNDHSKYPKGMLYIVTYGVLQSVFLQQDAISNLAESLGVSLSLPPELKEIRQLRNDSIGHPTKRDVNQKKLIHSFHHISRPTLGKSGFQLISTASNSDKFQFRDILIDDVLKIQSQYAQQLLTEVLDHLVSVENAHREKYMKDKLLTILPATLNYLFEKVREGIRKDSDRTFGLANFRTIVGYLSQFEEKLKERGEEDCLEYVKADLDYPTEKVMSYLDGSESNNQRAIEIFIKYIEEQYERLKAIASEIDEGYENRV